MDKTSFFAKLSRNISASRKYVIPYFSLVPTLPRVCIYFSFCQPVCSLPYIFTDCPPQSIVTRILKSIPSTIYLALFNYVEDFRDTSLSRR